MGKGDKKSKRGKIWLGTYGNSRKRKTKAPSKPVVEKVVSEEVASPETKTVKRKKTTRKKAEA